MLYEALLNDGRCRLKTLTSRLKLISIAGDRNVCGHWPVVNEPLLYSRSSYGIRVICFQFGTFIARSLPRTPGEKVPKLMTNVNVHHFLLF